MLSDRSSAPTLLGCRPSARNSLGRSQKRFQLLTKRIFCSVHHENNHSFKANSLLNFPCPRQYVGRGPDTMIVATGDVLRTVSIRLLKSLFRVSVCCSLVLLAPVWITTAATLSSSFRIAGICTETSRTRAPGRQWVCTLPSANVARTCRTIESDHSVTISLAERGEAVPGWDVEDRRGRSRRPGPGSRLPLLHPGSVVSRRRSEGHLWRSRPRCTGPVQRNTRSRGGGSVSSALHTYPGYELMSGSPRCFQRCFPFPQLGLFPKQLVDPSLHGLQLQLHRMQLERVLTCTQR